MYFPNGYPLIIAFLKLFNSIVSFPVALILLNILLSSASILLIYYISIEIFRNNKLALITAILVSIYPNQLNYVRFILTEVPSVFFLILSLFLFQKNSNTLSGISIGLASVIKTSLMPVAILFYLYLILIKRAKHSNYFILGFILPVILLLIYGYVVSGVFTLGNNAAHNFYLAIGWKGVPAGLGDGIYYYFSDFINNPYNFFLDRLQSLWHFWGYLPPYNEGMRESLIFRILIGLRFPLLILGIYGFIKIKKSAVSVFLFLPAFVLTIIHTIFFSNPRFTFPAEPFLIILAVYGLTQILLSHYYVNKKISLNNVTE